MEGGDTEGGPAGDVCQCVHVRVYTYVNMQECANAGELEYVTEEGARKGRRRGEEGQKKGRRRGEEGD